MQAMALELIPIANVFFVFTNTVGAALWAADMEDQILLSNPNNNNQDEVGQDESAYNSGKSQSYPTEETTLAIKEADNYSK